MKTWLKIATLLILISGVGVLAESYGDDLRMLRPRPVQLSKSTRSPRPYVLRSEAEKRRLRYKNRRQEQSQRPRRDLASYGQASNIYESEMDTPSAEDGVQLRLGLIGGMAMADYAAQIQAQGKAIHFGLNGDLRYHNFGIEGDGYFQSIPSQIVDEESVLPGATVNSSYRAKGFGGSISAKAQLPFYLGNIKVVPKGGVGYSIFNFSSTTEDGGSEDVSDFRVTGLHFLIGAEAQLTEEILIGADFIYGFMNNALSASGSQSPSFNRLRVNGFYRLSPSFSLGLQFQRDDFSASNFFGSTSNQFLGALLVHF